MTASSIYRSPAGEKEIMDLYDNVLNHWPVAYGTLKIPTRHGETFVIASGEASSPPLVLLHGSSSNAVSWVGDVSAYSRYFRTYVVDIPGEPGRSSPNRPAWNSPAYGEWLEDLLDSLKISKATLIGISQGGWTALKFATFRPQRVDRLVLLTPAGIVTARVSFLARAIVFSLFGMGGAQAINRVVFGKQPVDDAAVKFMNTIMTHFKPRIGYMRMYTDAELKSLTMPTLLIGGLQDRIMDINKISARLSKLVPHLTIKVLPDKGHVLMNMPQEVLPFLIREP